MENIVASAILLLSLRGINNGLNGTMYRLLQTTRLQNESPIYSGKISISECAITCSQDVNCYIARWKPDGEICELFDYQQTLSFVYPLSSGSGTDSVMFGKPISIVHVTSEVGTHNFTTGQQACEALGGSIAAWAPMSGGYNDNWLHYPACCFMDTRYMYRALQYNENGFGKGLNVCGYDDTGDVFCTLSGYDAIP